MESYMQGHLNTHYLREDDLVGKEQINNFAMYNLCTELLQLLKQVYIISINISNIGISFARKEKSINSEGEKEMFHGIFCQTFMLALTTGTLPHGRVTMWPCYI